MPVVIPVILSGGSGTRLWPMSTVQRPKQFLPLVGDESMFLQTLRRVADRAQFAAPMIVCGAGHVALVEADLALAGVGDATIIVEPVARNTAPAIALAAIVAPDDACLLVMPSDHVMSDVPAFLVAVQSAIGAVADGALCTFGIKPITPETGYGYIARGAPLPNNSALYRVDRFVEKPPLDTARDMVTDGKHLWNAGIFLMRADSVCSALATHSPAILQASRDAIAKASRNGHAIHPDPIAFATNPSLSIDYAVMEKAQRVVVAPVDPGWSDVGSWSALYDLAIKNQEGNSCHGNVMILDGSGCLVRTEDGTRIAMLGVSDLIVIAHGSSILILPRDRAQDIKQLIDKL